MKTKIINNVTFVLDNNSIFMRDYDRAPFRWDTVNRDKVIDWILALESGKYKQGVDHLYYKRKYCCLGVLGRINKFNINTEESNADKVLSSEQFDIIFPLENANYESQNFFVLLNDINKFTFNQIAEVLRFIIDYETETT